MYVVGFILIFAGMVIFLYAIFSLIFTKNTVLSETPEKSGNSNREVAGDFNKKPELHTRFDQTDRQETVISAPKTPQQESHEPEESTYRKVTHHDVEKHRKKHYQEKLPPKEKLRKNIPEREIPADTPQPPQHPVAGKKALDIFLAGYLYYDTSHSTEILLEKLERTPTDYLSHLKRIGNCVLEWKDQEFIFSYDENKIHLSLKNIKEVRFFDFCAAFLTNRRETPFYYFFSRDVAELKKFLQALANGVT